MKRKVTVRVDEEVIRRAKVLAAKRGTSVSGLATELARLVAEDERYEDAWRRAREAIGDAEERGGHRLEREELHER